MFGPSKENNHINAPRVQRLKRGFILVEALLSIVIIAVSLNFILQSFTATYRAAALNVDYTKAAILLENQMSLITQKQFVQAGQDQEGECLHPFENFHYHLQTTDGAGALNDVHLDISWKSGVKNNQISLMTYLLKPTDEKN